MINDVYRLHALEEYTARLEQETSISDKLILHLDSAIAIKDEIIRNQAIQAGAWKDRYDNQREITIQERRGKRRWIAVSAGTFLMLAVVVISKDN